MKAMGGTKTGKHNVMHRLLTAAVIAAALAGSGPPAAAQDLLTCDVQETRGSGENVEVIYSMNCRPVAGGGVTAVRPGLNGELEIIYGAGRPAMIGSSIFMLRRGNESDATAYDVPPNERNSGAVRR